MTNLIELQTSYATQLTTEEGGTQDWIIYAADKSKLAVLPKELRDNEVFAVLDFARKYELEAFNRGIEFMKKQKDDEIRELRASVSIALNQLRDENSRLANKLEQLIIEE